MHTILIALLAFTCTFIGGFFAIKFKDKLHLILGFSAGAIIGVAFFDLMPEAIELGGRFYEPAFITSFVALGFLLYLLLDRTIFLHAHNHDHDDHEGHDHVEEIQAKVGHRGILGALSLSIHSFLDGVAIGLAFQVSAAVGAIVAVAVLVHDFSDGINTVNMILKNNGDRRQAFRWLLLDAAAPVLGVISASFFVLPEKVLGIILALFSGFFLYIGASDLIPESHHAHPKFLTTLMTILGAAVLYVAIHFASF
jgi:zinc and cadmium transporter